MAGPEGEYKSVYKLLSKLAHLSSISIGYAMHSPEIISTAADMPISAK
jgi:hypothetical protein